MAQGKWVVVEKCRLLILVHVARVAAAGAPLGPHADYLPEEAIDSTSLAQSRPRGVMCTGSPPRRMELRHIVGVRVSGWPCWPHLVPVVVPQCRRLGRSMAAPGGHRQVGHLFSRREAAVVDHGLFHDHQARRRYDHYRFWSLLADRFYRLRDRAPSCHHIVD